MGLEERGEFKPRLRITSRSTHTGARISVVIEQCVVATSMARSTRYLVNVLRSNRHRREVVDLAAKHQLPDVSVFREAVEACGLMSYGVNIGDLARYYAAILAGERAAIAVMKPGTPARRILQVAM